MRAIIRFSVNGEANSVVRNKLRNILEDAGFVLKKKNTATYEHNSISAEDVAKVMGKFWSLAADPNKGGEKPSRATLDHVWTYIDEPLVDAAPVVQRKVADAKRPKK